MKQNIAVNIWFKHTKDHQPGTCKLSPEEATIDKYYFVELEKSQADIEGKAPPEPNPSDKYVQYLEYLACDRQLKYIRTPLHMFILTGPPSIRHSRSRRKGLR